MKAILITSSVLIFVLILLRYLLRGRITPKLQYALWLLVAVRLLVPVSLPGTGVSVLNAWSPGTTDTTVYVSSHGITTSAPAPETGTLGDGQEMEIYYDDNGIRHFYPVGEAPPAGANYTTVPTEQIFNLATVLRGLWLSGAALMAVWFLTVNLSFSARARKRARRLETAESPVPVYVSVAVPSPCLLGLVRQRIYVTPACLEDPVRLRHVLSHELTHRRQGDPWWSLVRALCLCLYWFDPLVWWAAALSRRDCELSCDEGAIRRLGEAERFAYGRTLVGLVAAGVSPGSLLQTATTMRSGKSGLKERIALIARKPRMLAVTALCLLIVVAGAAACTFTGAKPDSGALTAEERLEQLHFALSQVPEEYADQVIAGQDSEPVDNILLSFWYAPDYGTDFGGWLFWVYRWDQADFEAHLCDADHSGISCFAKDMDGYYYAFHLPTDVNFSPENGEDYHAVQKGLMDWAESAVLAVDGVESFTEDDVQAMRNQPFQFPSNHITAVYHPYYAYNGDWEPTWTLILAQPATQGDGGVWGVEQVWFPDGEYYDRRVVRPDTDLSLADYYADLQSQADAGQADWATDPMEVCLRYAHSYGGGHLNATAESFELSEIYSSAPYSGNQQAVENLTALLKNDSGQVIVELNIHGDEVFPSQRVTVPTDDPALQTLLADLTEDLSWIDTRWTWPIATDPWGDPDLAYFLSLSEPLERYRLTVYAGGTYVSLNDTIYQVTAPDGGSDPAAITRAWMERYCAGLEPPADSGLGQSVQETVDLLRFAARGWLYLTDPATGESERYQSFETDPDTLRYPYGDLGTYFRWTETDGLSSAREPASVTLTTADASISVTAFQNTGKLLIRRGDDLQWLAAEPSDPDDVFAVDVYHYLRCWYDAAQWEAHVQNLAISDTGQTREEIAQAWADAYEGYRLETEPGGRNTCTFVRVEARVNQLTDSYQHYPEITQARERFLFSYAGIFVPENDLAWLDLQSGNTTEYEGNDAPDGALTYTLQGVLYLSNDGWHCAGIGTGL